jgi:hypothetical protein
MQLIGFCPNDECKCVLKFQAAIGYKCDLECPRCGSPIEYNGYGEMREKNLGTKTSALLQPTDEMRGLPVVDAKSLVHYKTKFTSGSDFIGIFE